MQSSTLVALRRYPYPTKLQFIFEKICAKSNIFTCEIEHSKQFSKCIIFWLLIQYMFGTPIVVCDYMKRLYLLFFIASCCFAMHAQDTICITLDEAIALACKQSPQAVAANHQYNASYWNWRSFKANYLPNLSFTGNTALNRTIGSVTLPDGSDSFVHRNQLL